MYHKVYIDTNVLLNPRFRFEDYERVAISIVSVEEIDGLKKSPEVGYKARDATKKLKNATNVDIIIDYDFSFESRFLAHRADNWILGFAHQVWKEDNEFIFLTDDFNLYIKSTAFNIPCDLFEYKDSDENNYKGYREVTLSDEELAYFYENPHNDFQLLTNEYLILKNEEGEIVDKQRWNGSEFFDLVDTTKAKNKVYGDFGYKSSYNKGKKSKYEKFEKQQDSFSFTGKIEPRNLQQELAFDLFQNRLLKISVVFGRHGSGKDLIMSYHAIKMIEEGIFDKIVFVRNNYGVSNTRDLGALPGTSDEKLLPFAMPLADHLGGIEGLTEFINQGKLELLHLGFVRGRDLKRTIIYCTEAENMTKEHIQLLIGRLAEGSVLWLNGDFKQIDDSLFERNNGLKKAINCLKGNELFGCVELCVTERSKAAQLADLLD